MGETLRVPFELKRTELGDKILWELWYGIMGSYKSVWMMETGSLDATPELVMKQFTDEMKELGVRNIWDQLRGD